MSNIPTGKSLRAAFPSGDIGAMVEVMTEGNRDVEPVLKDLFFHPSKEGIYDIYALDDMNIRGSDINIAFNVAGGSLEQLRDLLKNRSEVLVKGINSAPNKIAGEPIVSHGASSKRSSNPGV